MSALSVLFLLVFPAICLAKETEEPICTSRFDYEYKVLHKLVMLEIEQNKIKELIAEMSTLQDTMEEESFQYQKKVERLEIVAEERVDVTPLKGHGHTYVRWGRTECPENGTEMVYRGYTGGGYYNNKGAAANYICLPEDPVWGIYEDSEQSGGTVWGAEYEHSGRNMESFFGKTVHENDVPCCLCRTSHQSVIMLPGRNICYDGWTLEYSGYLTSGNDGHQASTEFVCLDGEPEIIDGGISNANGKLFYFVEARCGSLRCPPYVNGRELTCAVCSK